MKYHEAELLLTTIAGGEPAFVAHSKVVASIAAQLAQAVARATPGIDIEKIKIQALLHDIGRSLTHGNYHGWVGYAMLRNRGLSEYGRGCITHWLRGLTIEEVLTLSRAREGFIRRVFHELQLPELTTADRIISVADFSVAHTTVVSLEARELDLEQRYGSSRWLQRNAALAREQRAAIEQLAGRPLREIFEGADRGPGAIRKPDCLNSK